MRRVNEKHHIYFRQVDNAHINVCTSNANNNQKNAHRNNKKIMRIVCIWSGLIVSEVDHRQQ